MNGAHLHLILTHLPVVGVLGAIGILAVGLWRRQEVLQRTGLVILVLTGLSAGAAYLTGEGAEEVVENQPAVSEAAISRHESAAEVGMIGAGIVGLIAAAALVLSRGRAVPKNLATVALAGAVIVSASLAWTANLGGQIRHPEAGAAVASSSAEGQGAVREDDD